MDRGRVWIGVGKGREGKGRVGCGGWVGWGRLGVEWGGGRVRVG